MKRSPSIRERQGLSFVRGNDPRLRALLRADERPAEFGHKVWDCTWVLLDHLDTGAMDFKGKRVLEIGCGWGLLGVYLAKTHGCEVTCTDLDERVLPIVRLQAEANRVSVHARQASFDDLTAEFLASFDLVLGVEVCYSEEAGQDIQRMVARALAAGVEQVLLVDPGRPDFRELLAESAMRYDICLTELPGSANSKVTHLLHIAEEKA